MGNNSTVIPEKAGISLGWCFNGNVYNLIISEFIKK